MEIKTETHFNIGDEVKLISYESPFTIESISINIMRIIGYNIIYTLYSKSEPLVVKHIEESELIHNDFITTLEFLNKEKENG